MKRFLCVVGVVALALSASSAGSQSVIFTKITRIGVNYNGIAYLEVTVPGKQPGAPACADASNWAYAFDATTATGQAMLSMAITAKTTGQSVRTVGAIYCVTTHEALTYLDLLS